MSFLLQRMRKLGQREFECLYNSQSSNVVTLIDSWLEEVNTGQGIGPHQMILMEICHCSLEDLIEANPQGMELKEIKALTAQIVTGLDFIHGCVNLSYL